MALSKYEDRISNLTGISTSKVKSDWLTDAAREVIATLPLDRLASAAEEIILPEVSVLLQQGEENIMKFTQVPDAPNNNVSFIFKNIWSKLIAIIGNDDFSLIMGDELGANLMRIVPDEDYKVYVNEDVTYMAYHPGINIYGANVVSIDSLNVDNQKIMNVVRYDGSHYIPCREIEAIDKGRASVGSGYIDEATETDPVYYIENNRLHIIPVPVTGNSVKISTVMYPSINKEDTLVPMFPDEFEHLIMLRACINAKQYMISQVTLEEDLELAVSHTNHMSTLKQDYQTSMQILMAGAAQSSAQQAV